MRVRLERLDAHDLPWMLGGHDQPLTITGGGHTSQWDGPVEVSRTASGWVLGGRGGPLGAEALVVSSLDIASASNIVIPRGTYPGIIQLLADDDSQGVGILVVNVVPMEQYLPGVLQAELFTGWPQATFEAQAIAARSFASMEAAHRVSMRWDVTDTPATQAYMGIATDPVAAEAVQQTNGQVLAFNNALVPGYFGSCCGGLPATGTEAIGPNPVNAVAPLQGHVPPMYCKEAPVYAWTADVSGAEVHDAVHAWGVHVGNTKVVALGTIDRIEAIDPNHHGRPVRLRLTDTNARTATIDCVDLPGILMDLKDGPPKSGWFSGRRSGGRLHLEGRGFGHGAGLCQYGAAAMGGDGQSADAILRFYYPKAEITTAYKAD